MTTDTTTLADWLLERLSKDEAVARAASPGPWRTDPGDSEVVLAVDDIEVATAFALSGPQTRATATHITRHDPARVLREVAAKRRIVREHDPDGDVCAGTFGPEGAPCPTLRTLASVYAGAPGWREEWAL